MNMKVDQASTSSPKFSMLKAKAGFVIPKNKLSGSMVPIFRGGKKQGGTNAANEENAKEVHRKTKWGPDLTQDATVRRGRVIAYQTRMDQITQQLKSRHLDIGDGQSSQLAAHHPDQEPSSLQNNQESSELLELERREVIGEILKLNPSYKTPPDYKPLLKEAKVPIPVKEYPGYNFLGLIFWPGSDTQKRLEKETGAKIQIYGTKADIKEKVELTSSNEKENQSAYEELYVLVSADTYEKVDAAVALIEILVNPVSGKLAAVSTTSTSVSGDGTDALSQNQDMATPHGVPTILASQGVVQPVLGPSQIARGQFQYPGPWFPRCPPHTPIHPPSGFIPSLNHSAPIFNNPPPLASFNTSSMPSLFGPQPTPAAGFGSILQNPSLAPPRPQPSMQGLQHPFMPQARPLGQSSSPNMLALQSISTQPNNSVPLPFTGGQLTQTGTSSVARPQTSLLPQPLSNLHIGPLPNQPMNPASSSSGWSVSPVGTPASLGQQRSMVQMAPSFSPSQRPHAVVMQPVVVSMAPPSNSLTASMVSPVNFPFQPSTSQLSSPARRPAGSAFSSNLPPQLGSSPASSASSLQIPVLSAPTPAPIQLSSNVPMHPVTIRTPAPNPSPNTLLGSGPFPSPVPSASPLTPPQSGFPSPASGSAPNFTLVNQPSVTAPKPPPNSGDFTFQPHRPRNPASQTFFWPSSQSAIQNALPPRPALGPQAPSSHVNAHNSTPLPVMQGFPRPQFSNHMGPPQPHLSAVHFGRNPNAHSTASRLPAFPSSSPAAPSVPFPHMGPRNFHPANQMPNSGGPLSSRPGNPMQFQQNYAAPPTTRQGNFLAPNQFSNYPSFAASGRPASGGQQVYDPFTPTTTSRAPQQQSDNMAKGRKQDDDPEYDDLMASVGVN